MAHMTLCPFAFAASTKSALNVDWSMRAKIVEFSGHLDSKLNALHIVDGNTAPTSGSRYSSSPTATKDASLASILLYPSAASVLSHGNTKSSTFNVLTLSPTATTRPTKDAEPVLFSTSLFCT